jgi:hypothetical protein
MLSMGEFEARLDFLHFEDHILGVLLFSILLR